MIITLKLVNMLYVIPHTAYLNLVTMFILNIAIGEIHKPEEVPYFSMFMRKSQKGLTKN